MFEFGHRKASCHPHPPETNENHLWKFCLPLRLSMMLNPNLQSVLSDDVRLSRQRGSCSKLCDRDSVSQGYENVRIRSAECVLRTPPFLNGSQPSLDILATPRLSMMLNPNLQTVLSDDVRLSRQRGSCSKLCDRDLVKKGVSKCSNSVKEMRLANTTLLKRMTTLSRNFGYPQVIDDADSESAIRFVG